MLAGVLPVFGQYILVLSSSAMIYAVAGTKILAEHILRAVCIFIEDLVQELDVLRLRSQ